jgi:hypothetical protein
MQTFSRISRASAYFVLLFLLLPLTGLAAESRDVGVTITIGEPATSTSSGGGGGGGTFGTVTSVVLSGYAYPGAIITYVDNGVVIGTGVADSSGLFLKSFSVPSGLSQFGLWARDTMDFISPTTNIGIYLQPYVPVTISDIVIGPTITGKTNLAVGEDQIFFGSAYPGTQLKLFNVFAPSQSPYTTMVSAAGRWQIRIPASSLFSGSYTFQAMIQAGLGGGAGYSQGFTFLVGKSGEIVPGQPPVSGGGRQCFGSDFNGDGRVNIQDFSIFLFYWHKDYSQRPPANACVDRNGDRRVDIKDFSIVMHDWSK